MTTDIPAWVNSNYELYQIQRRRQQMLDDRIRETYAEDYGDPLTAGEIIKAGSSRVSRLLWYGRHHYVVEIEKALCWNTEPMSCQELFYRQAYKIVDSL